ncbi:MAG TPA: AraC family transcriptional regulator [Chloroflexia bacterium]|nr:AraC family transcriptional regulator [Chloroflexia bacterium]
MTEQQQKYQNEVLGAGYSYHARPFHSVQREGIKSYLIRLQTEGHAYALVGGELKLIQPGDLLIYAPGDPYELKISPSGGDALAQSASADYYIFCRGAWLDNWWELKLRPRKINISVDESILTIWRQIIAEKRRVWDEVNDISDYLLRSLCLALDRIIGTRNQDTKGYLATAYRLKHYIEQNATTHFTLDDAAKYAGLSVSRVVHLFKTTFGQSIMDYTIDVRLSIACERIRLTSMPLEQIAETSGFRNYSYFSRMFRSRYHVSPRQYRNQMQ